MGSPSNSEPETFITAWEHVKTACPAIVKAYQSKQPPSRRLIALGKLPAVNQVVLRISRRAADAVRLRTAQKLPRYFGGQHQPESSTCSSKRSIFVAGKHMRQMLGQSTIVGWVCSRSGSVSTYRSAGGLCQLLDGQPAEALSTSTVARV